jgi:predicted patatin/cPLA2 family phospholipase
MRGAFSAGVLDYFMDEGLLPRCAIGVSAGALNGLNYVAGARGRSIYLNTKYCTDWRYFSMRSFLTSGNVFNTRFCYDRLVHELEPFNFEAYEDSPLELVTVSSNLVTGQAEYTAFTKPLEQMAYLQASASMPLVSRTVRTQGKRLLDGGICDSVPLAYSQRIGAAGGATKHIVVLTREEGYIKQPNTLMPLMRLRYARYPKFIEQLATRHHAYNRSYTLIKRLQETGEVFVIRPCTPVQVSNMEHDPEKLFQLHASGYEEARRNFSALQRYLEL